LAVTLYYFAVNVDLLNSQSQYTQSLNYIGMDALTVTVLVM